MFCCDCIVIDTGFFASAFRLGVTILLLHRCVSQSTLSKSMPSRSDGYPADGEPPTSLEHVIRSEAYPKPIPQHIHPTGLCESLGRSPQTPFECLPGEGILYRSAFDRTLLVVTNFRLFVLLSSGREGLLNVPLLAIDYVEPRDLFYLHVFCKDCQTFK